MGRGEMSQAAVLERQSDTEMNGEAGESESEISGNRQNVDTACWSAVPSKPNTFLSKAVRSQICPRL